MLTSFTNAARSHGIDSVAVAVGKGVLLGSGVSVSVVGGVAAAGGGCVLAPTPLCASSVSAAAVWIAANPGCVAVGGEDPEGKLQPAAAKLIVMTSKRNILFSMLYTSMQTILSVAPKERA